MLYERLAEAAGACAGRCVALSGGIDSSAVAYLLRGRRPLAVTVAAEGFVSPDQTYAQAVAGRLGLRLAEEAVGAGALLDAAADSVRILRSFNDIEVRNAAVMRAALGRAREEGHRAAVTGDGADELLAGYSFMARLPPAELGAEVERICASMRFASHAIGRDLGVAVESPFLAGGVAAHARSIPAEELVGERGGRRHGKMPLRRAFEGRLPGTVVWRRKDAMQDGAGTAGLPGMIAAAVPDAAFELARSEARSRDGVMLRTKESAHYYSVYRRLFGPPEPGRGRRCPYCRAGAGDGARYCRACGAHPI